MVRRDIIEKIITAGTQAPSGSNSQPWRFEVDGNRVLVIALPERDHPILNYRYRGTWVAMGALIENMMIAAQGLGVSVGITTFPDAARPDVAAILVVKEGKQGDSDLYPYISLRGTNRKAFEKQPLMKEELAALHRAGSGSSMASVRWATDPKLLTALGRAASTAEILMLENKALHKLFFQEIVWTRSEEQVRGGGLYIDTMEVPPPARFGLRYVLRHWPLMKIFIAMGIPRKIAAENAASYASAGAMGAIVVQNTDIAFLEAGRVLERTWLTATKLGLSFHLITGIPFFWQRATLEGGDIFSSEHRVLIQDAYQTMKTVMSVQNDQELIAILFRVGRDGKPTAHSQKRTPEIIWK